MPRYLVVATYTAEGTRNLIRAGATACRSATANLLKHLGGRLEEFYFAFGENDAYLILDVPDGRAATTISTAVTASGAASIKTIALLLLDEIDQARRRPARSRFDPLRRLRGIGNRSSSSSNGLTRYMRSKTPRKTRREFHPRF